MGSAADEAFIIEPSVGILVWTLFAFVIVPAGIITAAKGRFGWLALGLVTSGLLWPVTAWLIASPDSPWARRFYGPEKMRRAMRAFPRRLPHPNAKALHRVQ